MRLDRNYGLALILIGLGVVFLINGFGASISFGIGKIMGYLIPLLVMYLGYIGMKNGKTFFGGAIFIIGGIFLLGKLSWLIGIILSIGLIVLGISMLKKRPNVY